MALVVGFMLAATLVPNNVFKYMQARQAQEAEPFLNYFEKYYLKHDGWDGVQELDLVSIVQEVGKPEKSHHDLALADAEGKILLVENPESLGKIVTNPIIQLAAPILINQETVGYLLTYNFIDRILASMEGSTLNVVGMAFLWALIIALGFGTVMSAFMIRAILRPIGTTIDATKQISQGNLSLRVPLEPYKDLSPLGEAVNEMAAELERNQENQRYLLMDIAHDLRTPLSVQKAIIEAFEDGVYEFNHAGILQLKHQNDQLVRLVEDIRLLSLTDSGEFMPNKVLVEINAYLEKLLYNFSSILAKKSIGIDFVPLTKDIMVEIDPHLMTRVFENLLQNAYQHSPEDSVIEVCLRLNENRLVVTIRDHGSGIPEDKLDTIFMRYYRINHVQEGEPEGLGLGLSISRRIVESHGGVLYARNHETRGAEFVIDIPCTDQV